MSDLYKLKPSGIMVYSTVWCPDCKRAKQFFGEQRVAYTNVDIEHDKKAMGFVEKVNEGYLIDPFWVRIEIPHLPEEAADQAADPQGQHRSPVPHSSVLAQRTIAQPYVDRLQNEID